MRTEEDLRVMFENLTASVGDASEVRLNIYAATRSRRPRVVRIAVGGIVTAAAIVAATVFLPTYDGVRSHPAPLIGASVAQADPVVVLRLAATSAKKDPDIIPRPDQFYYVHKEDAEWWFSMDGTHDWGSRMANGPIVREPGCRNGTYSPPGNPRKYPCTADRRYVSDAPENPDAMVSFLQKRFGDTGINGIGKGTYELLKDYYLRPAARAAVFEALTRMPGLTVVNSGIPATLVGVQWGSDGYLARVVFDRSSHSLIDIQTEAGGAKSLLSTTPITAGIVDHVGQLP